MRKWNGGEVQGPLLSTVGSIWIFVRLPTADGAGLPT